MLYACCGFRAGYSSFFLVVESIGSMQRCVAQLFPGESKIGVLQVDTYCFSHCAPSFFSPAMKCASDDVLSDPILGKYRKTWAAAFLKGCAKLKVPIHETECTTYKARRGQKPRVLTNLSHKPTEAHEPPYTEAPVIYSSKVPRY